jgi:hypothetical protein
MTSDVANGLLRAARKEYAQPREWRGTFEPVPRALWRAIEVWEAGTWIPLEESTLDWALKATSSEAKED